MSLSLPCDLSRVQREERYQVSGSALSLCPSPRTRTIQCTSHGKPTCFPVDQSPEEGGDTASSASCPGPQTHALAFLGSAKENPPLHTACVSFIQSYCPYIPPSCSHGTSWDDLDALGSSWSTPPSRTVRKEECPCQGWQNAPSVLIDASPN